MSSASENSLSISSKILELILHGSLHIHISPDVM
jgi:hypothetical protein